MLRMDNTSELLGLTSRLLCGRQLSARTGNPGAAGACGSLRPRPDRAILVVWQGRGGHPASLAAARDSAAANRLPRGWEVKDEKSAVVLHHCYAVPGAASPGSMRTCGDGYAGCMASGQHCRADGDWHRSAHARIHAGTHTLSNRHGDSSSYARAVHLCPAR